jgi:hypothetical protein
VALTLQTDRQGRTDPATTHDDEVHAATLHRAEARLRAELGRALIARRRLVAT